MTQMTNDSQYIPDCLFPTDNDFEIPVLDLSMQAKYAEIPFVCFGEQKRTYKMNGHGTLHFYTDDYRFSSLYEHPEKILQHNPANIVEPNFSLFNDMAVPFGIEAVYKKRFIARSCQEKGIGVFVDLNVAPKYYKINLLGVPRGWGAFCTRGNEQRINWLQLEYEVAKYVANGNRMLFVVYGGGPNVREWCKEHQCVYATPLIIMKNKIKAFEKKDKELVQKLREGIMFYDEPIPNRITVKQFKEDLYNHQVLDFSPEAEVKRLLGGTV